MTRFFSVPANWLRRLADVLDPPRVLLPLNEEFAERDLRAWMVTPEFNKWAGSKLFKVSTPEASG